jgi:hypothetical protein
VPDVRELHSSVRAFAREVGAPLTHWQLRALELEVRISAIVAPRQSGKSRSLAVLRCSERSGFPVYFTLEVFPLKPAPGKPTWRIIWRTAPERQVPRSRRRP